MQRFSPPSSFRVDPRPLRFGFAMAALVACLAAPVAAAAAPDTAGTAGDAIGRFLADRRLAADPQAGSANVPFAVPERAAAPLVDRLRDGASDMVLTAMNFLGVRYRRGGSDPDRGFDCSGFTRLVFEMSLGRALPRRADEQATAAGLQPIDRDELRPGDLVFFNTMRRTFSHVGIYVGAGKFIHSPRPGSEVRVDDMRSAYWDKRFTGGRRAETED